jgi:hypothetical protein
MYSEPRATKLKHFVKLALHILFTKEHYRCLSMRKLTTRNLVIYLLIEYECTLTKAYDDIESHVFEYSITCIAFRRL